MDTNFFKQNDRYHKAHAVSRGVTWYHVVSRDATCCHVCHVVSRGVTCNITCNITCAPDLPFFETTCFHVLPHDPTWLHVIARDPTWSHVTHVTTQSRTHHSFIFPNHQDSKDASSTNRRAYAIFSVCKSRVGCSSHCSPFQKGLAHCGSVVGT